MKVWARWRDSKYYPAKILEIYKDSVRVNFIQDSVKHTVKMQYGR